MTRRLLPFGLMALVATLPVSQPAGAEASEAVVKAEFLPRFARYVTWPNGAAPKGDQPFVLCVLGDDPFRALIDQAARGQTIDGRRISVRRLAAGSDGEGCQIAFVAGTSGRPAGQMLAAIGRRPVLTVTDAGSGGQRGIIHFAIAGGRVRFFIDQGAAEKRGLAISSRLLALAVGVRK